MCFDINKTTKIGAGRSPHKVRSGPGPNPRILILVNINPQSPFLLFLIRDLSLSMWLSLGLRITLRITGSKKQGDEKRGAALFAVQVQTIVRFHFQPSLSRL